MMTRIRPIIPRNNRPPAAGPARAWRGVWWAAQLTALLFSSYVWLIVAGLAPLLVAALVAGCLVLVAARTTRFGLWWRFGVRELGAAERDRMLAAVVPIGSLRGRRQPVRVWEGRRLPGGYVVFPTDDDLVISSQLVRWVRDARFSDEQVSAVVAHGLGQQAVTRSVMVAVGEAFTLPWYLLVAAATPVVARVRLLPLITFAWKARWVIFAVAVWQSASEGRWVGFWGVLVIATLSWSTGFLQRRWLARYTELGDRRVITEGLGPTLAALLRRPGQPKVAQSRLDVLTGSGPG